ncbi:MAG: sialidase family protein [Armatimonadota bacterium]
MSAPGIQCYEDFAQGKDGHVPERWCALSSASSWAVRRLSRPPQNHDFRPVVDSPVLHVAFPVMARCAVTGRLYVVYRQGYTHATSLAARDGVVMMVTSDDDGRTWSHPRCIFSDPDMDDRNAAVGVTGDGTVLVCWDQYLGRWHHRALAMASRDGGETWSEPIRLGEMENLACRGRPIELSDGSWLFPVYCHYGTQALASFAVLLDPATGRQEQAAIPNEPAELGGGDEFSVCETKPGQMFALIRSNEVPWLIASWSEDYGRRWSPRRLTEIPSQFTPADLFKLPDGRLGCSFSFRERRNERLVISSDGGGTWDVENSLDIFDATVGYDDRSYVSSAVLDEHTVGSVLYETRAYPQGGRIWFACTDLRPYEAGWRLCLHHAGTEAGDAVRLGLDGSDCTVCVRYRFTGRFVDGQQGGVEVRLGDASAAVAFSYWVGIDKARNWQTTNRWELDLAWGSQKDLRQGQCQGDSFNDGNEHTLILSYRDEKVVGALDDYRQVEVAWPGLRPAFLDLVAHYASLAVYKLEVWR